ncbi:MAG: cyanophycin synthetase, partial [Eubacteriales bacterium]|nr:cyanophycin synthetase [Eubacteriales bacterium]
RKLGVPYPAIKEGLKNTFVRGRMELVPTNTDFTVIIDFAHNELSVQNLFETIKQYNPKRIISVFGCGGNRSKLRRYSMGEIIGRNSDISVVTSDNSRYERIEDIVADILIGINKTTNEHVIIYDRKKAIEHAIDIAKKGDVILLIGKGDEDYEEREGVKYPFSERQIVLDYVKSKYGNSKKPQDS